MRQLGQQVGQDQPRQCQQRIALDARAALQHHVLELRGRDPAAQ